MSVLQIAALALWMRTVKPNLVYWTIFGQDLVELVQHVAVVIVQLELERGQIPYPTARTCECRWGCQQLVKLDDQVFSA